MRQGLGDMDDAGVARAASAGRTMRVRKVVKPCPACKADIGEFLVHGQVNRCGRMNVCVVRFALHTRSIVAKNAVPGLVTVLERPCAQGRH